jgi:hypothetical protein
MQFFRRLLAATALWWLCAAAMAQAPDFSHARVSLLTASAGEELYASFWHSAVRVCDTVSGQDWVFNYGLFDYDAPNFYGNFARGRMNYCVGATYYRNFVDDYAAEGRYVWEQTFRLDSAQRDFMVKFLLKNVRPENRYYRYHFFMDNCATRIRDLIAQTYPDVQWQAAKEQPSYRELVYRCTENHPWGRFGIDIALGLPTDERTDAWKQMFLPEYLADACAHATSKGEAITEAPRQIVTPDVPLAVKPSAITPMMVCMTLLILAILCWVAPRRYARLTRGFDFLLFLTAGLVGLLVCFLWFFTDHDNTHGNLNIFWALPTHVIMAFFLLKQQRKPAVRIYFLITSIIAVVLLAAWFFLPQHMNIALFPLTAALALRALAASRKDKIRRFSPARKQ